MTIVRLAGWRYDQAFIVSLVLLIGYSFVLIKNFPRMDDPSLIALFTCVALLVNPYLLNYDFAFAILPLFVLAGIARTRIEWVVIAFIFFLPWFGLTFGRDGNITLLVSTITLAAVLLTNLRKAHTIAAIN